MTKRNATMVEVGPRDGFQSVGPQIATETKLALIEGAYAAGVRRVEAAAFVSEVAVPQMADAVAILTGTRAMPGLDVQVLVPNAKHAARAMDAGASHIAFVLSVSEKHNMGNVRRRPEESVDEYARIVAMLPAGTKVRLNLATAFDCPFDGTVSSERTIALLDRLVPINPDAEICPCDTTGRITPDRVSDLFQQARTRFPQVTRWAYHGHDTYGLGVANALSAFQAGVDVIDASFGGLGGCPFAPGATGNVATEDVVWTFEQMGIDCGIDIERLLAVARSAAALPGAVSGGRVRTALNARCTLNEQVSA